MSLLLPLVLQFTDSFLSLIYNLYPPVTFVSHEARGQLSHHHNAKVPGIQKVPNEELCERKHIISAIEKPTDTARQRELWARVWETWSHPNWVCNSLCDSGHSLTTLATQLPYWYMKGLGHRYKPQIP